MNQPGSADAQQLHDGAFWYPAERRDSGIQVVSSGDVALTIPKPPGHVGEQVRTTASATDGMGCQVRCRLARAQTLRPLTERMTISASNAGAVFQQPTLSGISPVIISTLRDQRANL
jgi:hypothetical protein